MSFKETHCDRVPETCFTLQKTEHYVCTPKCVCVVVTSFALYPKYYIQKTKFLCMPGMHMGQQRYRSLNLTSKWKWMASLILHPLYPWGKSPWYMLEGSLDVPQSMEVVWLPWVAKSKVQQNEYFKRKILILCSQQILNNRPNERIFKK